MWGLLQNRRGQRAKQNSICSFAFAWIGHPAMAPTQTMSQQSRANDLPGVQKILLKKPRQL